MHFSFLLIDSSVSIHCIAIVTSLAKFSNSEFRPNYISTYLNEIYTLLLKVPSERRLLVLILHLRQLALWAQRISLLPTRQIGQFSSFGVTGAFSSSSPALEDKTVRHPSLESWDHCQCFLNLMTIMVVMPAPYYAFTPWSQAHLFW